MNKSNLLWFLLVWLHLFYTDVLAEDGDVYKIGVGIADITGPSAEVEFWGYATLNQSGEGIHTRIYSRAFIIDDGDKRVVLVTADMGSISHIVRLEVLRLLKEQYGERYTEQNFCLTATHTHSGPGGFHQYNLYVLASGRFSTENFRVIVNGIVKSIAIAHENMKEGRLFWNSGLVQSVNYNRSPRAYMKNPPAERNKYHYDVNKEMQLIKMVDIDGKPLGMINWFAVHPTSMNSTNRLISGDNKGYASIKFEETINGQNLLGKGPFVGAFPQESHGDTSPNLLGPRCIDTGEVCDVHFLNCRGDVRKCVALGPGKDMTHSTEIIGSRLKNAALKLFEEATEIITGKISFIHQYYNITNVEIKSRKDKPRTCKPALGINFGLGTTDGAGENVPIASVPSSEQQKRCHFPKQILFNTGEMSTIWQPEILPTQIIRIGNVVVLPVPAEFTTMSGRRLKEATEQIIRNYTGNVSQHVVVQSLSNDYSSYVTTYEEYQENIYEGASTAYGPHTLEAYVQQYAYLTEKLLKNETIDKGSEPPNNLAQLIKPNRQVARDLPQNGSNFGDVLQQPEPVYTVGQTVTAIFVSGNPRNDLKNEKTYLTVDKQNGIESDWEIIATDANWETKFLWKKTNKTKGESQTTITWDIPDDTQPANYRIRYFGAFRDIDDSVKYYLAVTRPFAVTPKLLLPPGDEMFWFN